MASVVVNGDTSGAVTLSAPAVAGTVTVTLPAASGTMLTTASTFGGTGPAFSAYKGSGQSISSSTNTKVQFTSEQFDTANCFDSTTNYRFTPNVAGYYEMNVALAIQDAATNYYSDVYIYKNGSQYLNTLFGGGGNGSSYFRGAGSTLIYFNGSTDYLEVYINVNKAVTLDVVGFSGFLARAA